MRREKETQCWHRRCGVSSWDIKYLQSRARAAEERRRWQGNRRLSSVVKLPPRYPVSLSLSPFVLNSVLKFSLFLKHAIFLLTQSPWDPWMLMKSISSPQPLWTWVSLFSYFFVFVLCFNYFSRRLLVHFAMWAVSPNRANSSAGALPVATVSTGKKWSVPSRPILLRDITLVSLFSLSLRELPSVSTCVLFLIFGTF